MSHVLDLTHQTFSTEVLQSPIPVLVDFWAPWCGPCRMMAPILEAAAARYEGKIKIAKLNVDEPAHQSLAMTYRIQGIPNMQVFKGGATVQESIGYRPEHVLFEELDRLV